MRAATSLRLLLVTAAAMLAAGCDDESDLTGPGESLGLESPAPDPEPASGPLEDFAYWADGYLQADPARGTSYQPLPDRSFNRSGGPITVTKVGGTTGRYDPAASDYKPVAEYASNPVGGSIYVQRKNVGSYEIGWTGANAEIRDLGNPQVTAYGGDNAQCKVEGLDADYVEVQCFAANGVPMDANYTVLLGS